MEHCVAGRVVPGILKYHNAFMFRTKQSKTRPLDTEDEGSTILPNISRAMTQLVISQEIWTFTAGPYLLLSSFPVLCSCLFVSILTICLSPLCLMTSLNLISHQHIPAYKIYFFLELTLVIFIFYSTLLILTAVNKFYVCDFVSVISLSSCVWKF
jgi:hypothetical protein